MFFYYTLDQWSSVTVRSTFGKFRLRNVLLLVTVTSTCIPSNAIHHITVRHCSLLKEYFRIVKSQNSHNTNTRAVYECN